MRKLEFKRILSALYYERADLFRGLILVAIFRPAAYLLPKSVIWGLALACATVFVLLQASGRYLVREYMLALGLGWQSALRLAIRSFAKRFNEFSLQQKMINGLYKPGRIPVHLDASDEARRIIDGPGSFVLAQSHFERGTSAAAVFLEHTFDKRPIYVVALTLPPWAPVPHLWRNSLQLRQVIRASLAVRPQGLEFVYTGGVFGGLVHNLQTGRVMVSVNVDANWSRNRSSSLQRPFCGRLNRSFSVGAAKLARLANVPVLLALPVFSRDHHEVRIRVFGPFTSSAATPEQQDIDVTNAALDIVEREVGRRPSDYVLAIGAERCWDSGTQLWNTIPAPQVAAQRAPGVPS